MTENHANLDSERNALCDAGGRNLTSFMRAEAEPDIPENDKS
ncbi:hypothetical protein J3A65_002257 [Rhizobium sp. PvP014]|nr:hypothetical protein [Rhizobium sp. PvP014]MBP2528889.1 hypothetical protein [Rhizobium sp. PvP099]